VKTTYLVPQFGSRLGIAAWSAQSQQWPHYGLDDRGSIPRRERIFSLRYRCACTGSGTHPGTMGTEGSHRGGKATGE